MVTIRPAQIDDIPAIQEVAERNLQREAVAVSDETRIKRVMSRIYSDSSLQRAITGEGSTILVAELDDKVVGVCSYGSPLLDECEDIREIHRLLVHPDYVRRGVGSAFINAIETEVDEEACVQLLTVYVTPQDIERIRFYLHNGFHHEATEDKDEMWYLEKELCIPE